VESKILNFPNAMKLAQILGKYIGVEKIDAQETVLDFITDVIKRINPFDYSRSMIILTQASLDEISKLSGDESVNLFLSGLGKNKILSLLATYKTIGFEHE